MLEFGLVGARAIRDPCWEQNFRYVRLMGFFFSKQVYLVYFAFLFQEELCEILENVPSDVIAMSSGLS